MKLEQDSYYADIEYMILNFIKKHRNFTDKALIPFGISHAESRIFTVVYNNNGISQESIMDYVLVDRTTVSRRIKKLENLGYIAKIKDPDDKRSFKLYTTEKSKYLYEVLEKNRLIIREIVSKGIEKEESDTFKYVLSKINQNLSEI